MSEHSEFDLVAVGGGFAGLVAALRGAELGLRSAVVEQGADARYLCSSRRSCTNRVRPSTVADAGLPFTVRLTVVCIANLPR